MILVYHKDPFAAESKSDIVAAKKVADGSSLVCDASLDEASIRTYH